MKANDIQLDHFRFLVDTGESIEEIFAIVEKSQSVSTISSLAVMFINGVDIPNASIGFTHICQQLRHLTS